VTAICGCTEKVQTITNSTVLPQHTYISPPSHTSDLYQITISEINTSKEGILISNRGTAEVSLFGWKLKNGSGNFSYTFPEFSLKPEKDVTVFLNKTGRNSDDELYATDGALKEPIDAIKLYDPQQNQIG
jgi:hypothetical protein